MRTERIGVVGAIAGVVLGGLVAAAGCVGADDEVSGGDEARQSCRAGLRFTARIAAGMPAPSAAAWRERRAVELDR